MKALRRFGMGVVAWLGLAGSLWGGGSGLNVLVVVNENSTNSVQLGNYYRERRQVPPQNYLRIDWAGGNGDWSLADFTSYLAEPLADTLSRRQLASQIDYVMLSMDIPYRVTAPGSAAINSTTSALFYGFKPEPADSYSCPLAGGSSNAYAASEGIFRATPPIDFSSNSFLVTMITDSNLDLAERIVDSGVAGDATFPAQTAYLVKSDDGARNVRYWTADDAVFNTRVRGNSSLVRTNADSLDGFGTILGAQTGSYFYVVTNVGFVPGALADNLTSYGGLIFQDSGHLNLLSLVQAGAAGSYGTVDEPCNYLEKFPAPMNYFYQARGFSLAECYYQSLVNPYQGLVVGEPLSAPFAAPAAGVWEDLPPESRLSGVTNLTVEFTASDPTRPVQQVDLFIDGAWFRTLTNIPPSAGDRLTVTIGSRAMDFTVPPGATLLSAASGLAGFLNEPENTNATKVLATAYGDRVELQSSDLSRSGAQLSLSVSAHGTDLAPTTHLAASGGTFLDTVAHGLRSFLVTNTPGSNAYLVFTFTKTNSTQVTVGVTNTSGSTLLSDLVQQLQAAVNTHPDLRGPDGLVLQDVYPEASDRIDFNLVANAAGWNTAEIQVNLEASADLGVLPKSAGKLEDNLNDLRPRAHLYVTAGVTNLPVTFPLDTTAQPDGYHELTAVAYEGSHVRTQCRLTQAVRIQNGAWTADLSLPYPGTNVVLETTLPFTVTASTSAIRQIELFSTGGTLGSITNQAPAVFSVPAAKLGVGLHPFYARVTASDGSLFRTRTLWVRIGGPGAAFPVLLSTPPPTLSWPATPGQSYEVLAATNVAGPFQIIGTASATGPTTAWADTNATGMARFYRVRSAD